MNDKTPATFARHVASAAGLIVVVAVAGRVVWWLLGPVMPYAVAVVLVIWIVSVMVRR